MFTRRTLLMAGAGALAACATPPTLAPDPQADADLRALVDRLADRSRAVRAFMLRRVDAARLSPEGRVLYEALLPGAEADAALTRFPYGDNAFPYAVTHRNGLFRRAAELRVDDNPRAGARAISRETARMLGDAERGIIAPDFVLDATLPPLDAAVQRVAASSNEAHRPLAEALARQLEAVRALRARAPSLPGVGGLPDGHDFYAAGLQFYLGAQVDPAHAFAQAFERSGALNVELAGVLPQVRSPRARIPERLRALARQHYYSQDDAGKAQAIADMRTSLARIRTLIAPAFQGIELPDAQVHALPAAQEANGTRGVRRGNAYYVDLGGPRASWTLPSVVHHELLPGHILQAQFEEAADAPLLQRRYSNGYGEGWSIYAEQLADELGAFVDNPHGRVGYIQWMLFRLARVVADIGMHTMGWSRDEAIQTMTELQGESIAFVTIEDDIARMAAQPGFAAAQGLSAMHISRLREDMRAQLRDRFDLSRFHHAMLRHGPLSPPGLEAAARSEFRA